MWAAFRIEMRIPHEIKLEYLEKIKKWQILTGKSMKIRILEVCLKNVILNEKLEHTQIPCSLPDIFLKFSFSRFLCYINVKQNTGNAL